MHTNQLRAYELFSILPDQKTSLAMTRSDKLRFGDRTHQRKSSIDVHGIHCTLFSSFLVTYVALTLFINYISNSINSNNQNCAWKRVAHSSFIDVIEVHIFS
jgi:hypothetical protein